ncbi:MAG TPA: COX15/CtaA family protein [Pyrinomonadaceae bacterium]|jgi:cytochrome c oxidase assembly protein subunit 15
MTKGIHRFILLTTCATFILIVAGALVTSNGAGLAAPDWPLSYGQVFPPMVGNLFYEHGHRLIASTVGFLVLSLNVYLWVRTYWLRRETPRRVLRFAAVALVLVCVQGLLGGITVLWLLPLAVSTAHATLAQLFFCWMVTFTVLTAPGWQRRREALPTTEEGWSLPVWCGAATAAIFVQLILGATLRHSASWDEHLPTNLLVAHITGACLVALVLGSALVTMLRRHGGERYLARPATLAFVLLVTQILLGVAAYLTRLRSPDEPQPLHPMVGVTVAHVATGALLLAVTLMLTLRSFRVLKKSVQPSAVSIQPNQKPIPADR